MLCSARCWGPFQQAVYSSCMPFSTYISKAVAEVPPAKRAKLRSWGTSDTTHSNALIWSHGSPVWQAKGLLR